MYVYVWGMIERERERERERVHNITEYIDIKQSGWWLYNDESTQCMGERF